MLHRRRIIGKGRFKNLLTFCGIGALCWHTAGQIPHFPRGAIKHRLDKNRPHIQGVGKRPEHRPHFGRKTVIPVFHVIIQSALRIACLKRRDQGRLYGCDAAAKPNRLLGCIIGRFQRRLPASFIKQLPRHVVIGTRCIGDAPMGHGAAWISR